MTNKTAASRYARALLDVAVKENANLEQVGTDLAGFAGLFDRYPPLAKVLLNPAVPAPRKRAAVADLLARTTMAPMVSKLILLLAERDRLVLMPDLVAAYRDRLMDYRQVVRAQVTTAAPIDAGRVQQIQSGLANATGRTVNIETRTDPTIIGGLVARVGSTVYDASVVRQLERMKERLENA
ncbi:MAG TPA: ATP synthase F1 subunit delta [Vicinamibacterales bacterium]|nr:ATP synthase F1 subunit delta [Vicinamibacterales bacterium]